METSNLFTKPIRHVMETLKRCADRRRSVSPTPRLNSSIMSLVKGGSQPDEGNQWLLIIMYVTKDTVCLDTQAFSVGQQICGHIPRIPVLLKLSDTF